MTPAEFRAALATLHWSARYVAVLAGYNPTISSQWVSGRTNVPEHLAEWLVRLAAAHQRVGPLPGREAA